MNTSVTPWWEVLKLRDEIAHSSGSIDDVQMSLFQAVHGTVADRPAYADATYYGEITHPSPLFTDLMAKVAVRLGGGVNYSRARALWRLDQAMGGGKSHGLIGLWHLAAHPAVLATTDTGREAFAKATAILDGPPAADLGNPQVVVLACDNMTAGKGVAAYDGPARTLYERFLWRLFGGDNALYLRYKDFNGDKSKIVEALTAIGRPVLILVDEIMDYIRQLSDTENADLAVRDMAFLRALLDSVNDVKNVAAVVVMIASEKDNMDLDGAGQQRRNELDALLIRNGETATINDNTDFAAILQRRLFERTAPAEVLAATARTFTTQMTGPWRDKVFNAVPATATPEFADEVARCYPFHPQLMALAEQEWAKLAGFQRVRSTIRIFAATAHSLHKRGRAGKWTPLLVGPGDLPLSDPVVREAVIGSGLIVDTRTQANYRQIASAEHRRGGRPFRGCSPPRPAAYQHTGKRGEPERGGTGCDLPVPVLGHRCARWWPPGSNRARTQGGDVRTGRAVSARRGRHCHWRAPRRRWGRTSERRTSCRKGRSGAPPVHVDPSDPQHARPGSSYQCQ